MGVEEAFNNTTSYGDFKENTVQEILTESERVDISSNNEESISSRLTPQHPTSYGDVSELTENLILCSASSVTPSVLDAFGIACIINVAPELPDTPLNNHDVMYHKIPVIDSGSARIYAYFDEATDLIHKVASAGKRTLVYCVAGVSRSASICIAYLMKYHEMNLITAYNYIKVRRPKIKPNCGFFKQLIEYEEALFGSNSVHMVYNEYVRMEIPDVYDSEYKLVSHFRKRVGQNCRH